MVGLGLGLAVGAGFPSLAGGQAWTAPKPTDKVEGGINWTTQVITASAVGVAPPYAVSVEHGRALAIQAGAVLARQELLAVAPGMLIASPTTAPAAIAPNPATPPPVPRVLPRA